MVAVGYQLLAISRLGALVQDFRKLKVWQKAHQATLSVYTATEEFPAAERYGLTSQMRRAASSIAANIAEGCGRSSDADFGRFLHHAMGSASELEYFILLARDLKFLVRLNMSASLSTLRKSNEC